MKLSIIIPVFNEQNTIGVVLKKVENVSLPGIQKEVIVVDDASTDNTASVLSKFKIKNLKFKILRHEKNNGKGAAVRTGLRNATGDIILIQDGDLEYDPGYYLRLLEPISQGAKVVYGTRLLNYPLNLWGEDKTILPTHLIANRFLTALTNILFGGNLTDMETGYKVFRKEVLYKIKINSEKFDFEAEITAKILKMGLKIVEVSIVTNPRTYKEGKKIGWIDGIFAIWTLIKYRFIN